MRTERAPGVDRATTFRHEALLYNGLADFVDTTASFIRDGLAAGDRILSVVSSQKISLLREELGAEAELVDFADMAEIGRNPARIIPAWYDFVAANASEGRSVRGIGEPISNERSPEALVECQRHESLLNLAFFGASHWWLLCPYDTSTLDDLVLEEALRSHPHLLEGGHHRPSDAYEFLVAPFDTPLPEPTERPYELSFHVEDLHAVREATLQHAKTYGLHSRRCDDLVVAMNEIAINSLRHGGGAGVLRLWRDGDNLVCEIRDRGRMKHPLAGRSRPIPGQEGGFGIWLVQQLCDLVQMRTFPDGSVVRVHMAVPREG